MKKHLAFFLFALSFVDAIAQQTKEYKFFGDGADIPRSVLVLPNKKTLIVLGQKISKDLSKTSCAVIKIDLAGNLLKQQLFGKEGEQLAFVDNFSPGRILMAGYRGADPDGKLWLRIADTNLNVIKDTVFQNFPAQNLYKPKFVMTKNGHLVVVLNGVANSVTIISMTRELKVEWTKELHNEFCDEKKPFCMQYTDFILDDKRNIVITGFLMRNHKKQLFDLFITKLSPDGKLLWRKTVGDGAGQYSPNAVIQANHTYFITSCDRLVPGVIAPYQDAGIYRFSEKGELLWSKKIGGSYMESATGIVQLNESTLLMTGYSGSNDGIFVNNKGNTDNFIIRIDMNGNISWHELFGTNTLDEPSAIYKLDKNRVIIIGITTIQNSGYNWKVYIKEIDQSL